MVSWMADLYAIAKYLKGTDACFGVAFQFALTIQWTSSGAVRLRFCQPFKVLGGGKRVVGCSVDSFLDGLAMLFCDTLRYLGGLLYKFGQLFRFVLILRAMKSTFSSGLVWLASSKLARFGVWSSWATWLIRFEEWLWVAFSNCICLFNSMNKNSPFWGKSLTLTAVVLGGVSFRVSQPFKLLKGGKSSRFSVDSSLNQLAIFCGYPLGTWGGTRL